MDGLTGAFVALRGWLLALMVMPAGVVDAGGRDVAVLVRREVPVYQRFAERFAEACDCSARLVEAGGDPDAAADAVRALRPGAVVAVGRSGLRLAVDKLADLPLIHALALNPQTLLPPTLSATPGAPLNVSPAESLALLRRLSPRVRTVAVVHDRSQTRVDDAHRAARELGLELQVHEVEDAAGAFRAADKALKTADAVLLVPDRTALRPEVLDHVLLRGLERRVPVVGFAAKHVRRGALLALSVTPEQVAVEAARLAEQRLSGVLAPTLGRRRLNLSLNLRTAARLGLQVPDDLQRRADDLIR